MFYIGMSFRTKANVYGEIEKYILDGKNSFI